MHQLVFTVYTFKGVSGHVAETGIHTSGDLCAYEACLLG
jgi:hypothetical protein